MDFERCLFPLVSCFIIYFVIQKKRIVWIFFKILCEYIPNIYIPLPRILAFYIVECLLHKDFLSAYRVCYLIIII